MIRNIFLHTSLRVIIASNFILVATTIVSLSSLLLFSGFQNTNSLQTLDELDSKYDYALTLEEAVDNLAYFSAEMSNSLSDVSLDKFEHATNQASKLIDDLDDTEFQKTLLDIKTQIERDALSALDAYIIDDRKTGDAHMAAVHTSTAKMKNLMDAHVDGYRSMRYRETRDINQRTKDTEKFAATMAGASGAILLISALLMWRALFSPIQMLIKAISDAASDTSHAANYQVKRLPVNEIGAAGNALNHLLVEVTSALSEARNRTNEAQKAEQKWQALFDGSPDAIVILDPESSEILDYNSSTKSLLCMNGESSYLDGTITGFDIHHHELDTFKSFIKQIQSNGFARSDNLSCAIEDKRIPVSVVGVTAPHEDGVALLMHIRDITEQRRHEIEIDKARIAAERANEAKSNFLANMSHEIRTPMNGVIGMADILASTELDEQQKELVSIIVSSGSNLITVINDILDFSKLEAGKMLLTLGGFNLRHTIEEVCQLLNARAVGKGIGLVIQYSQDLPEAIIADQSRIRQILINIVGNAVKFTERGQVIVSVNGYRLGQKYNFRIEVIDTGIGITDVDIPRMFEKFEQADGSRVRRHDGTGLGLAISKELIELMGGEIGVQSKLNEGSTFWIEFAAPLAEVINEHYEVLDSPLNEIKVLVIDECIKNQNLIRGEMDILGYKIDSVKSFRDGIIALSEFQKSNEQYHLIITGYNMPDVMSFSHQLKAERAFENIPVIRVCFDDSNVNSDKKNTDKNNICTEYSAEIPELADMVVQIINNHTIKNLQSMSDILQTNNLSKQKEKFTVQSKTPEKTSYDKRPLILVAEDNLVNQLVIKSMLPDDAYKVVITENGAEAIKEFKSLHPDLVIMDLSMPVMDGYKATQALRSYESENALKRTPIIAATAHALPEDRAMCFENGMDDFLTKPIRKPVLEEVFARWLFDNIDLDKRVRADISGAL